MLLLFKDLLGFKEIWSVGPVGVKGMAAVFGLEDMKALALSAPAALSLEVEDLDGLHQSLTQKGWAPFTPVTQMPTPDGGMVRMFCIRTDENVLFEFLEAPPS